MNFSIQFFIMITIVHLYVVTAILNSTTVNLQNIGFKDIRNQGKIGRVMNQTGFIMCARQCEQLNQCEGFNFMRSGLLCELLISLENKLDELAGWRFVNISSVFEDTLLTQIRGKACHSHGRDVQLSNNTVICMTRNYPIDCGDTTLIPPEAHNGIYKIKPNKEDAMTVYCDMATDGEGWTVIQKRTDGTVDFAKSWKNYKNGFGYLTGEHWLGNDALHILTTAHNYLLKIEMVTTNGEYKYAVYSQFYVASSKYHFRLTVGGYSGNASDALTSSNGRQFSSKDIDNDAFSHSHCSALYGGGWWFKYCAISNLNREVEVSCSSCIAVDWNGLYTMDYVTMKVKRSE